MIFSRRRRQKQTKDAYDHYSNCLCLPFSFRHWLVRLFDKDTPPLPPADRMSLALALAEQYVMDTQSLEDETASHRTVAADSGKAKHLWRPRTISNGSTAYESFVEKPAAVDQRQSIKAAMSSPAGGSLADVRSLKNPRQWVQNLFV
ncbi:hypothetical protein EC988_003629 [Linderina pennispora]|nr:hypothetical protein EC988_003629 [Linderina pennispora]